MSGDNKYAIYTKDPLGYTVRCSKSTWNRYIIPGHDELDGRVEDVKTTISNSDNIYPSLASESVYVACRAWSEGYEKPVVKVVVKTNDENKTGKVITAYTAMKEEGENIGTAKLYSKDKV